ncbi:hypothetical protein BsWGS_16662 [Bradybaena similaris]
MGYGTAQCIGFAGLVIGFLLAATGVCTPFWKHGEIDINTLAKVFSITIPFFGSKTLASIDIGLWWYCREFFDDKECDFYEIKNDDSSGANSAFESTASAFERSAKIWSSRAASVVCVILSLSCALAALCRTCCCPGGKTIAHGVIAFFAGGAGIVTIALFVTSENDDEGLLKIETTYAWGFYVFIAGTAIIIVVSFLLCFAGPDNPIGQVFPASAAGNTIIVANSTQHSQSFGGPQYAYPNTMYAGPPNAVNPGQHQQMNPGQYQEKAYQPPPNQPFYTEPDTHKDDMHTPHAWT